jgi:predicted porin
MVMTTHRPGLSLPLAIATMLVPAVPQAVEITAADWKFTLNGNVNVHYIYSSCEDAPTTIDGGLACVGAGGQDESSSVSNGLLPAAFVFGASTNQGGYDLGVTLGLFPGVSTNDGGSPNLGAGPGSNVALGTTGLDVRQVFLTFGNDRMGTFMFGRNGGLFGFDAIINDMTLPGVGGGNGNYAAPANTSLGSIGLGYIYTDWLAQMNYTTPDISGLKFTVGIFDPLEPILQGTPTPEGAPGFHGKVAWTAPNENLYLSATFMFQDQEGVTDAQDYDSTAFDVGGKFTAGPLQFMAYYYDASGVGTTGLFIRSDAGNGNERDSDGFIAQVVWSFGPSPTKLGFNYGESNLDTADGEVNPLLVSSNSKYTLGLYHSLTKNLTLLAEATEITAEAQNGAENDSTNFNIGAFLSF